MYFDDDEQAVLDAALEELAAGPLPFDELFERLLDRGLTLVDEDDEGNLDEYELDEEALDDILVRTDNTWTSHDGIVANVPVLLDGSCFTHRLTESELERGVVTFTPDLVVIDFDDDDLLLPDGARLELHFSRRDESQYDEHGSFAGPAGWLDGYAAGDLVAFHRIGQMVRLERIEELADGEAERTALAAAFEVQAGPGEGIEPIFCVFDALCADPGLFHAPVPPVADLLEAAGLRVDGAFVGRAHENFEPQGVVAERARRERIAKMFAFDRCCQEAFDEATEAWSAFVLTPPAATPTVMRGVGIALAHGPVAPAFFEWVTGRHTGPSSVLERFASALVQGDEGDAPPLLLRAANAELDGRVLDAEADLTLALERDPTYRPAALELVRYVADRGDAAAAVNLLRSAGARTDHPELQYLTGLTQALNRTGRNNPCPCGSGRKFKACCLQSPKLPIEARTGWLFHKLAVHIVQPARYSVLIGLAADVARTDGLDPAREISEAAHDPFVVDLAVFEGGGADEFREERAILLPDDERALLNEWCRMTRRLWEIIACEAGATLTLRDTGTGETAVVSDRTASRHLRPGEYLLARVVPAGSQMQLIGEPLAIGLRHRDQVLRLLDSEPSADEFADWYGDMLAPPVLKTREGEPMEFCRAIVRGDAKQLRAVLDTHYTHADDQWVDTIEIDGDSVVRAYLELGDAGAVNVTAWSVARLMRVLDTLRAAVPDLETVEVVLDEEPERIEGASLDLTADDPAAELLDRIMREKETAWLDESIPALDGLTPRQAADDPTRREDLVALLREFDRLRARTPAGGVSFDASRLRAALGLDD